MINAQDLCSVFNKTLNDGWGVLPGFDGQLLTSEMIENKISDAGLKKAASKWVGKHVADAGGLFAYAFRTFGMADGYTPDAPYIKTIFHDFCVETGKLPKGGLCPGMILFKKRGETYFGVGLYIGNSTIIEARNARTGVVTSKLNSEWTHWGRMKNVDYSAFQPKPITRRKDILDMRVLRGEMAIGGNATAANVRSDKSISSKVTDVLPPGTSVNVVEDCGEFCKIQYIRTGYVKKQFLKEVDSK